jgi:hypothetical protein
MIEYLLDSALWSVGGLVLGWTFGKELAQIYERLTRIEYRQDHPDDDT